MILTVKKCGLKKKNLLDGKNFLKMELLFQHKGFSVFSPCHVVVTKLF